MLIYRHVWLALLNEAAAAALLMSGLSTWKHVTAFLGAHALAVYFAYAFFGGVCLLDPDTRRIVGRTLFAPVLVLDCVPVIGPPGVLMFALMMMLYPVRALALEEYEVIDSDMFENLASQSEALLVLKANPVYVIHNRLSPEESLAILRILDRLDWFPFKTRILQIFLEHSVHPSVVLEAGRIIGAKRDALLKRIAEFEARGDEADPAVVASLYHELYHLALSGPLIGDTYLRRACRIINDAALARPRDLSILLPATLYNLKAGQYDVARRFLKVARELAAPRSREAHLLTRLEHELRTVRKIEQGMLIHLPEGAGFV